MRQKPSRLVLTTLAFIVLSLGVGCDSHLDNNVLSPGELFQETRLIEAFTPGVNDTVAVSPLFTWQATGRALVFVGLFTESILVRNNKIVNTSDNIWAWHSGLGRGLEGNVRYEDGVGVVDGDLQYGLPPKPLVAGAYYWAVWAWDNSGLNVTHSSKEMFFTLMRPLMSKIRVTILDLHVLKNCEDPRIANFTAGFDGDFFWEFKILQNNTEEVIRRQCKDYIGLNNGDTFIINDSREFSLSTDAASMFQVTGWIREDDNSCEGSNYFDFGNFTRTHSYEDNVWDVGIKELTFGNNTTCIVSLRYNVEVL